MSNRRAISVRLPADVVERLQAVCYWMGRGLTMTGIIEDATVKALEKLEAQYLKENKKKVPPRPKPLD
jgi:predicted DNA-binding protein